MKANLYQLIIISFVCLQFLNAQNVTKANWQKLRNSAEEKIENRSFSDGFQDAKKAYEMAQKLFSEDDQEYIDSVHFLAVGYLGMSKLEEAKPFLDKNRELVERKLGTNHKDYAETLHNLAYYHNNKGEIQIAEDYYLEALEIRENTIGQSHEDYGTNLNNLATIYQQKGESKKAVEYFKRGLSILKETKGEDHPNYILMINNMAATFQQMGEYKEAIPLFQFALDRVIKTDGKDNINYGLFMINLGLLYYQTGNFVKSKAHGLEGKDVLAKTIGKNHLYYAVALSNIAMNYLGAGDFNSALDNFLESEKTLVATVGKKNPNYPVVISNLSRTYQEMGDYQKAYEYNSKAIELTRDILGEGHSNMGMLLSNRIILLQYLGDFENAFNAGVKAQEIIAKTLGKEHENYSSTLINTANIYTELDNYDQAIKVLYEGLEIVENRFNEDSDHKCTILNNLGNNYNYKKDYKNAKLYYEESTKCLKNIYDEDNYRFAQNYNNIAMLYSNENNYNKAIELYSKAIDISKKSLNPKSLIYSNNLINLGFTYVFNNEYEKGTQIIEEANYNTINILEEVFKFRSEYDKKNFLATIDSDLDGYQSLSIRYPEIKDGMASLNLNNQLLTKGLLLNSSKDILTSLESLNDNTINENIFNYRATKATIAKQYAVQLEDRVLDMDSLERIKNQYESDLVTIYNSKFKIENALIKDWRNIQNRLSKRDVAIEFSHFTYRYEKTISDSTMYVAYVYNKDVERPIVVPLFEEKELKSYLKGKGPNDMYKDQKLYDMVWKPLENHVKPKSTVYYSPSGILNQLQFTAITNNDKILNSKYNLVQLSNTSLLANGLLEPKIKNAVLIGGVNYDLDDEFGDDIVFVPLDSLAYENTVATRSRGETWNKLDGTVEELENIKSIFDANGISYRTHSRKYATEERFKRMSGNSPDLIHIATHGFFYENLDIKEQVEANLSTEDYYRLAQDPLLRSGLILAGANYTWKNGQTPEDKEDGILTAMEISNLDLSNTKMVVLSACETGLGDINGSEGVYGLQRAFKMAGVDILVMSLWQVPDEETAEFMSLFYSKWLEKGEIRKAFRDTQKEMAKKYKDTPEKWAAFVLFE